jgi:KUP system potassium uptake protein
MLATTILTFFVIRFAVGLQPRAVHRGDRVFRFHRCGILCVKLLKVHEGGWFPLALAAIVFTVITTWHRGREIASATQTKSGVPLPTFLESLTRNPPHRVPGTAIFMVEHADTVSRALLQNFACNKVCTSESSFLTILIRSVPWVPVSERIAIEPLGGGLYRMLVYFGFMDRPDVTAALELCAQRGLCAGSGNHMVSVEPLHGDRVAKGRHGLWRERLFGAMTRNARTAGDYFNIPRTK